MTRHRVAVALVAAAVVGSAAVGVVAPGPVDLVAPAVGAAGQPDDGNATATPTAATTPTAGGTETTEEPATPADGTATPNATGGVVARGGDRPQFDPGVGGPSTVVVDDPLTVVFRGEDGLDFETSGGDVVDPADLVGTEGDAEGVPLQVPIPTGQPEGPYTLGGRADAPGVVVQTPRVSAVELINPRGVDVAGAAVEEGTVLLVRAEWNFAPAEDLALRVADERGNVITGDVLATAGALSADQRAALSGPYAAAPGQLGTTGVRGTGTGVEYLAGLGQFRPDQVAAAAGMETAFWVVDTADLPPGNYTVRAEGWQDLNTGGATRTVAVEVTAERDVTLDLAATEARRGRTVPFTVRGSTAAATHLVTVDADAFVDGRPAAGVFPPVEDVVENGVLDTDGDGTPDAAYARVVVDPDTGLARGEVDSVLLAEGSVDVALYPAGTNRSAVRAGDVAAADEATLSLSEATLAFEAPTGTYVVGEAVAVRGTATAGIDSVAVYALTDDTWRLLDVDGDGNRTAADAIAVDADGSWDAEDVVLSEAATALSFPGRHRLGVVEVVDVAGPDGDLPATLSATTFDRATSEETAVVVEAPRINATTRVVRAVGGEVALADGVVDVRGTAPGEEAVLLVAVDSLGQVLTEQLAVDDDGVFEEDALDLSTARSEELAEGEVRVFVVGTGRDGVVGDGSLPGQDGAGLPALEAYVTGIGAQLTPGQTVELLLAETRNATGSDDVVLAESFRYVEARTTIEAAGPADENVTDGVRPVAAGEPLVVRGTTNRRPESAAVGVTLRDEAGAVRAGPVVVEGWDLDGEWSAELSTAGLAPGTYVVVADDGESTDRVTVAVTGGATNSTAVGGP